MRLRMSSKRELDPAQASAADSGVWRAAPQLEVRRAGGPGSASKAWPAWLSWCAAIVFFVGVVAVVLSALFHLTRQMLELGHQCSVAGVQER
jgi:hypothetical protein